MVLSVVRGTIIRPTAKDSTDAAMPKAMLCKILLMRLILVPCKESEKTVPDERDRKRRCVAPDINVPPDRSRVGHRSPTSGCRRLHFLHAYFSARAELVGPTNCDGVSGSQLAEDLREPA